MKTMHEWLQRGLRPEHYRLLLEYRPLYDWDHTYSESLYEALCRSVSWTSTHEGFEFWELMSLDILQGSYKKKNSNIFLKL